LNGSIKFSYRLINISFFLKLDRTVFCCPPWLAFHSHFFKTFLLFIIYSNPQNISRNLLLRIFSFLIILSSQSWWYYKKN